MAATTGEGLVIVTGASGHIGREVCRILRAAGEKILPLDVNPDTREDVIACDLRSKNDVSRLFQSHRVQTVIHLAAILPSAFQADPLVGAEVNLSGCFELMRQAVDGRIKRFVFTSSMSVYGSRSATHPLSEDDPAVPDEPYGASKRVVELVGQTLAGGHAFEFISLRVARVIGPGIKRTASPWRSQIFEAPSRDKSVQIPYAPEALLSLVHVEDVARMLVMLAKTAGVRSSVYNTPVELWQARDLKKAIEEVTDIRVELGRDGALAGPVCDGGRFVGEFGFKLRGLRERLACRPVNN
jgi:nucleoside-diphosphate-sugar epimerase